MKSFVKILIKWLVALIKAGHKPLILFAENNKISTNYFLFAFSFQKYTTFNTGFFHNNSYNYGMNYPRSAPFTLFPLCIG